MIILFHQNVLIKLSPSKTFNFTGNKFDLRIKRIARKTKILFNLKDKGLYQVRKIYQDVCSCEETFIGKMVRNVKTR